ncbi:MAG TPA: hypothetical protein PK530_15895 [Anaerolineales bacterium]|nr:hypothetical protein [Anaerolineales bacterium]
MTESKPHRITKSVKILFIDFVLIFIVPIFLSYLVFRIALPNDPSTIGDMLKVTLGLLPELMAFLATGVPFLLGVTSHNVFIDAVITLAVDGVLVLTLYHIARKRLGTNIFDSLTIAVSTTISLAETAFMLMFVSMMILSQGL